MGADQGAGLVDLLVGDVLADHVAEPLGPRLGSHRERPVPAPAKRRDQLLREAVGADRRDRDLEALLVEDVHQAADPRIVGHARPDEPDAARILLDLPHRLPERLEAPVADGPVDLPLEAEPAAAAAPLPDLEEGEVPVLGVGRPEERDGPELVHLLEPPLAHHGRGAGLGPHLGDGAVIQIRDRVALRHVDALDRRQAVQEVVPPAGVNGHRPEGVAVRGDDLPDDLLTLADHHEVHERGHGLRVREGAHAAHQDDGVLGPAGLRPERDSRRPEEAHRVDVVPFVRDREPDQVEVGERTLGLEREGAGAGPLVLRDVLRVRQEHPLADDAGQLVQVAIDRLEPQVGHPDRVGVGVDESERDPAPPVLPDGAGFLREQPVSFFLETPRHAAYSLTDGGKRGKEPPPGWSPS